MNHIMNKVNRQPPEELFHYSDFAGLNGIVFRKEVWMGDLFFLNDKKEYELGIDLFKDALARQKEKHDGTAFKVFLDTLDVLDNTLKGRPTFSFSLSEDGDLLSQWRGYTNNGIGVSIGFNTKNITNGFQLLPCIYSIEDQKAYIDHLFELAYSKFISTKETEKHNKINCNNANEIPYWDAINESGSQFISQLSVACAIIKDPSFSEEKEWRLIAFGRGNVEFLPKSCYLKPISKLEINPSALISSIKIGPNPNQDLCLNSINSLLKATGIETIKISVSHIPYRN